MLNIISHVIRGMYIKTTRDTTSNLLEYLKLKRQIINVSEDVEKWAPSSTAGGNVK